MSRIVLTDTTMSAIVKMVEGVPGAARVCAELLAETPKVDPDCAMGGMMKIMQMDDLGIYGSRIWMLYKDVCGEYIDVVIGVLRANQLGYISETHLNKAIDSGLPLEVIDLIGKVQKELPNFKMFTDPQLLVDRGIGR